MLVLKLILALDCVFLMEPLPASEAAFAARVEEGRARLTLIANEIARLAAHILTEHAQAARKVKDAAKAAPEAAKDAAEQLQRLLPPGFITATPWSAL